MILKFARIGGPDIYGSRIICCVTKRNRACDNRPARLLRYIHHTGNSRHFCHVGNNSKRMQVRPISGCRFRWRPDRSQTYVRRSIVHSRKPNICAYFMAMQETNSYSHSSTEADIVSLDARLRMDGIHALILWETVPQQSPKQCKPKKQVGHHGLFGDFNFVTPNAQISSMRASLYVSEETKL